MMRSAEFAVPADGPARPAMAGGTGGMVEAGALGGPCAPARTEVDSRCADADRLLAAAESHQEALREARRQHAEVTRQREADAEVRDRRRFNDEKTAAQAEYHAAIAQAKDRTAVQEAAAEWLNRMHQLNRRARDAERRADELFERVGELDRRMPALELAADAARISAETAQQACMDARRLLATCEEDAAARLTRAPATEHPDQPADQPADVAAAATAAPPTTSETVAADPAAAAKAARTVLSDDRQRLLGFALRLAEETGIEAGRLQLLLLELREQITARALENHALVFPEDHPFWSQFPWEATHAIASSLASLGYRFDGVGGWADGRVPQARDLAMALSYSGYDPRSLRRPAGQEAIDTLWQGTTVRSEEYLLSLAPDFTLSQIVSLLGSHASRLGELWDIWGRLRPMLMRAE